MRSPLSYSAAFLVASLIVAPVGARNEPPPGWTAVPDQRFLGHFTGTAVNTTFNQGGQMSINVEPSIMDGHYRLSIKAWDGLGGSGKLEGEISDDGKLRASGDFSYDTIWVSMRWDSNFTGTISDNKLVGNYTLAPKFNSVGQESVQTLPGMPRPTSVVQEGTFNLRKFVPVVEQR